MISSWVILWQFLYELPQEFRQEFVQDCFPAFLRKFPPKLDRISFFRNLSGWCFWKMFWFSFLNSCWITIRISLWNFTEVTTKIISISSCGVPIEIFPRIFTALSSGVYLEIPPSKIPKAPQHLLQFLQELLQEFLEEFLRKPFSSTLGNLYQAIFQEIFACINL